MDEVAQKVEEETGKTAEMIRTSAIPSFRERVKKAADKMGKATTQLMEKAEETARTTRLRLSIKDQERGIEKEYVRIGKTIWELTNQGDEKLLKNEEIKVKLKKYAWS